MSGPGAFQAAVTSESVFLFHLVFLHVLHRAFSFVSFLLSLLFDVWIFAVPFKARLG